MADDTRPAGRRGIRRGRRRRVLHAAAWTALGGAVLTGAGATAVYLKLDGNIAGIDLDAMLRGDRPKDLPGGSLDLLLLGSDSRSGPNSAYGDTEDRANDKEQLARSDTAMIVHLTADRDAATVVSIPRDTLVTRPPCRRADGRTAPAAERVMFNEAYTVGGPACTVRTVEAMTGIRMDHFVEIDFHGFEKLVDTLGGVEITTHQPIRDDDSHLRLPPGTHVLDGREALALVRTRKSVGDGSDLGRIGLQHSFVRALADRAGSLGLFSDPRKLYDLADTATSAVTTDSELASVSELSGLARTLQDIDPEDLQLMTLPVVYDRQDPNRLVPLAKQAGQVWAALRRDEPVPRNAIRDSATRRDASDAVAE